MRGGRSRRRWERGKAGGVATGEPATGSDPGEWSRSGDESPEMAVSAETKPSPTAANGRSRNEAGAPERRPFLLGPRQSGGGYCCFERDWKKF